MCGMWFQNEALLCSGQEKSLFAKNLERKLGDETLLIGIRRSGTTCAWYVVCEYVELVRAIVRCILQRASKTTQLSEQGGCWERLPLTFQPIPPFTMISEWWRKIPLPMDSVVDCNKLKLDYKPYIIHDAQHHAYLSSLLPFCTPLRNSLLDPYSLSIKTSACGCASDDNHRRHHYRQRHHPRVLFSVADQTHGTPDL